MTTKAIMPGLVRVADVMTSPVLHLRHDMTIDEAADTLRANQISGAPVLHGTQLVGVLSRTDLSNPRRTDGSAQQIDAIMTKVIYAVRPGDPLYLAIQLMVEEGVHRVLAVSDDHRVAGVLTPIDVCRAVLRQASATLGQGVFSRDYVNLAQPAIRQREAP